MLQVLTFFGLFFLLVSGLPVDNNRIYLQNKKHLPDGVLEFEASLNFQKSTGKDIFKRDLYDQRDFYGKRDYYRHNNNKNINNRRNLNNNEETYDKHASYQKEQQHFYEKQALLEKRGLYDTFNGTVNLKNYLSFYTIDFDVGTPRQSVSSVLDTGSSDLWFYDKSIGHPPYFDSNESSTFRTDSVSMFISYGSGPVKGFWGNDTVQMNNAVLNNLTFGLVTRDMLRGAPIPGIMGLGRIANEATVNKYLNVPSKLFADGYIKKNAFSIFLNSLNAGIGTILFGGVDPSRYIGPLYEIPMANESHLSIPLSGISLKLNDETTSIPNSGDPIALLDTGTSFTYLPDPAFNTLVNTLGASYSSDYGVYFVPNITEKTPSLAFNFSGAQIIVPAVEYILPVRLFTSDPAPAPYILSIFKNTDIHGLTILGANFLRSAYTVFDITDGKVALAQAKYDMLSNNRTPVKPIVSGIPDAISPLSPVRDVTPINKKPKPS